MSFISDFKAFAIKGNMIDLAVGVIIGGAFGKIVSSLVQDVIMPPIGLLLGGVNFNQLFINLGSQSFATLEAAEKAGVPLIKYGVFINSVVDFTIVALVIFIVISQIDKLKKQPLPADPTTKECPHCLSTIPLKATRCGHCTSELK
ncbi:large-conductance mechanosensitive channel protein MscL [Sulfurirhabdus autotrophica]|uniref:Large-conductance mechanosensitive channel n=1 Tax=Sulfurirhabdus autotrophica TaxID=1706046 RepID=A0A4R3XXH3_9PROT|nr:large-conductance mechanosensitive channel protein MscL [Sulfurirhabdus autotrophica]TCV83727.1 large conductance mechanosensitive channel [Sulfurirhabdus autotrophica]